MNKRIGALLLALCLLAALAVPALALDESSPAVRTVRALGIMVGDENGDMNLGGNVTRAQFAKLLVAASRYRDSISPDGTGYALYRDLKNDHWASEYIRIAAQEGWMTGYTDSTFRPENTITLEEVCAATLRLLGYDTASLGGSFPYAHLSKASALGLRDELSCVRGQAMTRGDCAQLIYNLFSAQTASGQTYGTTIGLTVRDGEVDYITVLMDKLSGPFVASANTRLSFTPITVYRDGKASAFATLSENDVYYYNEGMRSVWIYTKRVSGKIESVTSSGGTPTAVTVGGKSYIIAGTDAAYRLSALTGTAAGNYVTLLLGMDDKVAGVLSGNAVSGTYYGVVQSLTKSASEDKAAVQTEVAVFCTDGVVRSFVVTRDASLTAGSVVEVSVGGAGVDVRTATSSSLSGRVSADGSGVGEMSFAENAEIIDAGTDGSSVAIERSRIAGVQLESGDVRFYTKNAAGAIDRLILNDVTGDVWTYAFLLESRVQTSDWMVLSASYTYLLNGKKTSYSSGGTSYAVESGGIAIRSNLSGAVETMRPLRQLNVERIENGMAISEEGSRAIAENAQVYLRQNGGYYLTELNAVNSYDYVLTGWYDDFNGAAGNCVRILIAAAE